MTKHTGRERLDLFRRSGALFTPDRLYRFSLFRSWRIGRQINFILLNPSTANETVNDPTVERCERRARAWDFGSLTITNLFAWCATDPADMKAAVEPVGLGNDQAILYAARNADLIVCAWGSHGEFLDRGEWVRRLLEGLTLHYLRMGKNGQPWHPLYLPYRLKPRVWRAVHG